MQAEREVCNRESEHQQEALAKRREANISAQPVPEERMRYVAPDPIERYVEQGKRFRQNSMRRAGRPKKAESHEMKSVEKANGKGEGNYLEKHGSWDLAPEIVIR